MDVVVSADWLASNLEEVRVVDVRDAWEYEGIGHVPGAVNVPFDSFRDPDGGHGMLPDPDEWATLLGEAGVEPDDALVAYDDTHGVFAARFLVTALLYGHRDVRLLDGDFSAWSREREVSRETPDPEPTDYLVEELDSDESPLVGYDEVASALDTDAVVVDTREAWEFEESHVPGAVQLDWRELVDDESRGLRPDEELREALSSRGVTPDRRILLYCNTARRISHTYLVLRHLGYEDVGFYEGSLTEWERRGGPTETGVEQS